MYIDSCCSITDLLVGSIIHLFNILIRSWTCPTFVILIFFLPTDFFFVTLIRYTIVEFVCLDVSVYHLIIISGLVVD